MSGPAGRLVELLDGLPPDLSRRVFTHSSWTEQPTESYERLAYLGDGVLGMVIAEELLKRRPQSGAGDLTKIRAQAASRVACARVAQLLGVPERLATNAPQQGAELPVETVVESHSVHAEVCEAVIGAVFKQHGYDETAVAVVSAFADEISEAEAHPGDNKSRLQEFLARRGERPEYVLVSAEGPAHERSFECAVEIRGDRYGSGTGSSKKEAEQAAAAEALAQLGAPAS